MQVYGCPGQFGNRMHEFLNAFATVRVGLFETRVRVRARVCVRVRARAFVSCARVGRSCRALV